MNQTNIPMPRGESIPYYKREKIAREYHLGPKPMAEIRKSHNLGKLIMWEITREFPPAHFMEIKDRPNRQYIMLINKKQRLDEHIKQIY